MKTIDHAKKLRDAARRAWVSLRARWRSVPPNIPSDLEARVARLEQDGEICAYVGPGWGSGCSVTRKTATSIYTKCPQRVLGLGCARWPLEGR